MTVFSNQNLPPKRPGRCRQALKSNGRCRTGNDMIMREVDLFVDLEGHQYIKLYPTVDLAPKDEGGMKRGNPKTMFSMRNFFF